MLTVLVLALPWVVPQSTRRLIVTSAPPLRCIQTDPVNVLFADATPEVCVTLSEAAPPTGNS